MERLARDPCLKSCEDFKIIREFGVYLIDFVVFLAVNYFDFELIKGVCLFKEEKKLSVRRFLALELKAPSITKYQKPIMGFCEYTIYAWN